MLTEQQFAILRSAPRTNRVAKAISLAGVTQVSVTKALGVPQPYVSDVARQRYRTTRCPVAVSRVVVLCADTSHWLLLSHDGSIAGCPASSVAGLAFGSSAHVFQGA